MRGVFGQGGPLFFCLLLLADCSPFPDLRTTGPAGSIETTQNDKDSAPREVILLQLKVDRNMTEDLSNIWLLQSLIRQQNAKEVQLHHLGPQKHHGDEGKNFSIDKDRPDHPYITCSYKREGNDSHSSNGVINPDGKSIRCYIDHTKSKETLGCMSVFTYAKEVTPTGEEVEHLGIRTQGCWQHEPEVIDSCVLNDVCVHHDPPRPKSVMFCCCSEHRCNEQVYMAHTFPHRRHEMKNTTLEEAIPEEPEETTTSSTTTTTTTTLPPPPPAPLIAPAQWPLLILVIVIGTSSVAMAAYMIYLCCNNKKKKRSRSSAGNRVVDGKDDKKGEGLPLVIVNPKTAIPNQASFALTDFQEIAQGRYGKIYSANMRNDDGSSTKVAVKSFPESQRSCLENEIELYSLCCMKDSKFVLRYLGWMEGELGNYWLVTDYYPMGSLKDHLQENVLSLREAMMIMMTALEGLSYLHDDRIISSVTKPVIAHRDIKSRNVLLKMDKDYRFHSVLCDFGSAMICDGNLAASSHDQVGTRRYMAPEVLEVLQEFSCSALQQIDVYAMAMVMWEIVTRTETCSAAEIPPYEAPFDRYLNGQLPSLTLMRQLVVKKKKRPTFREDISTHNELGPIAATCEEMWYQEGEARITAACVVERLRSLMGDDSSEGYYSGNSLSKESKYLTRQANGKTVSVSGNPSTTRGEQSRVDPPTPHTVS